MKEFWVNIACWGYNGYLVSNLGRVKSSDRKVIDKNGNSRYHKGRILKPSPNPKGYLKVFPTVKGKKKTVSVHKLVMIAFKVNTGNKKQINHINGIKTDNRLSNLEWCTQSENQIHAFKLGLNCNRGSSNGCAKITKNQAKEIKRLLSFNGPAKVSRDTGISINIVKDISRGKTWNYV